MERSVSDLPPTVHSVILQLVEAQEGFALVTLEGLKTALREMTFDWRLPLSIATSVKLHELDIDFALVGGVGRRVNVVTARVTFLEGTPNLQVVLLFVQPVSYLLVALHCLLHVPAEAREPKLHGKLSGGPSVEAALAADLVAASAHEVLGDRDLVALDAADFVYRQLGPLRTPVNDVFFKQVGVVF